MNENLASPCISICLLDDNDMCVGCYRLADEITEWSSCDEDRKHEILASCKQRLEEEKKVHFK